MRQNLKFLVQYFAALGRSGFFLCVILSACCCLQSCSISQRIVYEDGEGPLPENLIRDVRKNRTEASWLISQLGMPIETEVFSEDISVHSWLFSKVTYKHANILLFFRYNTVESESEYFHVVDYQGLIKKYWRDQYSKVQKRIIKKMFRSEYAHLEAGDDAEEVDSSEASSMEAQDMPDDMPEEE